MLTYAVSIAVGAAIVACTRWHPKRPVLIKLSWSLFIGVVVQAVIGGISVKTHLPRFGGPLHRVVPRGQIAVWHALWVRGGERDEPLRPAVQPSLRTLGFGLTGAVGALIIVGTLVTG